MDEAAQTVERPSATGGEDEHEIREASAAERAALDRSSRSPLAIPEPARDEHRTIAWMRISDLVAAGSARVAGRGLDLESALARRLRTAPASTRRALQEHSHRLPPLSVFGRERRLAAPRRDELNRS